MVEDTDRMPRESAQEILVARRVTNRERKAARRALARVVPSLAPLVKVSEDEYGYRTNAKKSATDKLVTWIEGRNAKQLIAYARRRLSESVVAFKRSVRAGKNQMRLINLGQELKQAATFAQRELTARRNMVNNETSGN
jgi:hypothetical protein